MHNLLQIIKKAAVEAVEASNPTKVMYGTVTEVLPVLKIKIDQRFIVTEDFLILTKNVRNYKTKMSVNGGMDQEYTVKNALKKDDKVILLREQGGQNYIVIDKVGD